MAPVSFLFEKKGVIVLSPISSSAAITFDEVFEAAVEAGAEDVKENQDEDGYTFEVSLSIHSHSVNLIPVSP